MLKPIFIVYEIEENWFQSPDDLDTGQILRETLTEINQFKTEIDALRCIDEITRNNQGKFTVLKTFIS